MRKHQERVLVRLVGVLGRVSGFGGESKLGHAVVKLLAGLSRLDGRVLRRSGHLFRNRCSDIVAHNRHAFRVVLLLARLLHLLQLSTVGLGSILILGLAVLILQRFPFAADSTR